MSEKNIYDRMIDVLDFYGWAQGRYQVPSGQVCLMGAYNVAKGKHGNDALWTLPQSDLDELVDVIAPKWKQRLAAMNMPRNAAAKRLIIRWNDWPWRRRKGVIKALRKASARLQAKQECTTCVSDAREAARAATAKEELS